MNGILTADPNIVPSAMTLTELSYSEAADLAYYGADVLHPRTIRPVTESGIPVRILNTFEPINPCTLIVETPSAGREILPAIISTTGISLIAIRSPDDAWSFRMAARALQQLSQTGVEVLMFSQSFSERSLNLVVRQQDQAHCLKTLRQAFSDGSTSLGTREQVATISVVGVPVRDENSIVSHAFAALGKLGTRVIAVAQAATEHSVSFCIPEDQVVDAVRFLHRELGLERTD